MRVIAGKYKGRALTTVKDLSVRPATSKVKGSIFNTLQSRVYWQSTRVLDLYAGSGSLGIEALSRGAQHVSFVESSSAALVCLRKNIQHAGAEAEAAVWSGDALQFISSNRQMFGIVFADPPYELPELIDLPNIIIGSGSVPPDGYLIIEHPVTTKFAQNGSWKVGLQKIFGRTVVSFFQPAERNADENRALSGNI